MWELGCPSNLQPKEVGVLGVCTRTCGLWPWSLEVGAVGRQAHMNVEGCLKMHSEL